MTNAYDPGGDHTHDATNAWLAKFTPLLLNEQTTDVNTLRRHIRVVTELKAEAQRIQAQVPATTTDGSELTETFRTAFGQLDSLEEGFRQRLALLVPGDPQGAVNLDLLQERLAERSARLEVGATTVSEVPSVLELNTGQPNAAAAVFTGLFGLGWTAFTTVHCILMVGGMFRAFGPLAAVLFHLLRGRRVDAVRRLCLALPGRHLDARQSALGEAHLHGADANEGL